MSSNDIKILKYEEVLKQINVLISDESDWLAVLANAAAALRQSFQFLWVGFYRVRGEELVLGPFQGPVACTRIAKGRGVCGTAWESNQTIVVDNVHTFPDHIACSTASQSEIVVPVRDLNGSVQFLIDIDSTSLNNFDDLDKHYLEKIALMLSNKQLRETL